MATRTRRPPEAAEGPLWEYATGIAMDLADQGYAQNTIHSQLWLIARLSRWLAKEGLPLADLTPAAVERFENYRWERGGSRRKSSLAPILRYLRRTGVVPEPGAPVPVGAVAQLLERYREHLVVERGLARTTVVKYEWAARLFLCPGSVGKCVKVEDVDGGSVARFIGRSARTVASAQPRTWSRRCALCSASSRWRVTARLWWMLSDSCGMAGSSIAAGVGSRPGIDATRQLWPTVFELARGLNVGQFSLSVAYLSASRPMVPTFTQEFVPDLARLLNDVHDAMYWSRETNLEIIRRNECVSSEGIADLLHQPNALMREIRQGNYALPSRARARKGDCSVHGNWSAGWQRRASLHIKRIALSNCVG